MDKVIFADSWEEYFQGHGLAAFDDFYDYGETASINVNARRNVQKLVFDEDDGQKVFFMKRFHDPHFKDIFAGLCNFGGLISQAGVEWKNAQHLLNHGIGTYKPVCMGERTRLGFEAASFFVTEQLDSISLVEYVMENWKGLDHSTQNRIVVAVGELVAKIHGLGISVPDLYLWHIFISQDRLDKQIDLSIIDLHRMTQNRVSTGNKIKELGRLYWSMWARYFEDEHRELLLATYLESINTVNRDSMAERIRKWAAVMDSRRTIEYYYRHVTD